MRTIARSSSKRKSASALASSVLPVPVGPRKRNDPVGPVRVGDAGARAAYGVADRGDGLALPDQALADDRLHLEQLGGLALQHLAGRDAGPRLDDVGDLLGTDLLADERLEVAQTVRLGLLDLGDLLLERGDLAVLDLRGTGEVALAQLLLGLDLELVELAAQLALALELVLLALPAGLEPAQLLLAVGEVLAQHLEPVGRRGVGLLGERELLHLQPLDLAAQHVDLLGRGLVLHPQARRRLVDQVDRLVGQLAAGDVAVGQRGRRDQRGVGDAHAVVRLVLLLDAAQDLDGVLDAGLADEDLLEAALQRGVLLDALAVLVERGRADHVQLTAREHRLEHVAGVHRGVAAGARADHRVQLVDEGDDLPAGVLDLLEDGLEPLLELAAVLRARDHRREVERQDAPALERVGHVAGDDALGEALDDGGLADTGLADQDGVVLGAPATGPG